MNPIVIKRTSELSREEIEQICTLFNKIFPNHSISPQSYVNHYSSTPLGYSIHALLKNEAGDIVGNHNLLPNFYLFDGKRVLFAYGAGTMILKEYRNFLTYRRLIADSQKYAVEKENCSFLMGFPNENAYPVQKKGLKRQDIGNLPIFMLPIHIGCIKKSLFLFNGISSCLSKLFLLLSKICLGSKKEHIALVHKDHSSFERCRYVDAKYHFIRMQGYYGVYCVSDYNQVRTAFILDVNPLSQRNFDSIVRTVYKECKADKIDAIMFVGYLPFKSKTLFRVPEKLSPKKFYFVGTIFDNTVIDKRIFELRNWEVSLADYDLI